MSPGGRFNLRLIGLACSARVRVALMSAVLTSGAMRNAHQRSWTASEAGVWLGCLRARLGEFPQLSQFELDAVKPGRFLDGLVRGTQCDFPISTR